MGAKIDYFASLPDDVIVEIALTYPHNEIDKYCRLNRRFNQLLCRNNVFWYRKLNLEYSDIFEYDNQIDWNLRYRSIGRVYASGDNTAFILGLRDYGENCEFSRMNLPLSHPHQKFRSVSIGNINNIGTQHIIMIDTHDNLWGIGSNDNFKISGLLDEDDGVITDEPLLLPNFSSQPLKTKRKLFSIVDDTLKSAKAFGNKGYMPMKALEVSCGESHTVIIDLKNNIWSMGENRVGQLGLGKHVSSVKVPQILFGIKAISVSCYLDYTALIDVNNDLYVMGKNRWQLGVDHNFDCYEPTQIQYIKATSVSTGYGHMTIIDDNNNVWLTGTFGEYDLDAQAGTIGDIKIRLIPEQIADIKAIMVSSGNDHCLILDTDLNVWIIGWYNETSSYYGKNFTSVPILFEGIKASSICAGGDCGFIIDTNNDVWVYGSNDKGRLGLDKSYRMISIHHPIKLNNIKAIAAASRNGRSVLISL
jgi:alpha-tubulin suppressor-like RCC1 family protein